VFEVVGRSDNFGHFGRAKDNGKFFVFAWAFDFLEDDCAAEDFHVEELKRVNCAIQCRGRIIFDFRQIAKIVFYRCGIGLSYGFFGKLEIFAIVVKI